MKNIKQATLALITAAGIFMYGCGGPNDDKGSMDQKNSNGEGAVDSTRIPNFDSSNASLVAPKLRINAIKDNTSDKLFLRNKKQDQKPAEALI